MTTKCFPTKRHDGFEAVHRWIGGGRLGLIVFIFLAWNFSNERVEAVPALEFDGMDDVVEISPRPVLGDTFTEEAWILPSPKDDRYHGIVGNPSTDVNHRAPGLWITRQTVVHAGFGDGKGWHAFGTKPDTVVLDAWNHVAATYDGTTYRIFANGVEVLKQPLNKKPLHQPISRIGRVDYWFPGAIREVRLWNRALSGDEIRRQMSQPLTGTEEGLVAYFPLNDGSGLQAKNAVSGGGNGTLVNGPQWIDSTAPIAPLALKSEARAVGPGSIENVSPLGENVAPDTAIEIILHKAAGTVEPGTIQLSFDKSLVDAIVSTNEAGGLLVRYEPGTLLEGASSHKVELSYVVNGAKEEKKDYAYKFSISPHVILSK